MVHHKTLKVRGMFGEHCERAIIDAFEHIGGITNISVNLKNGTISFSHAPEITPLLTIKDAITHEGYDVIG